MLAQPTYQCLGHTLLQSGHRLAGGLVDLLVGKRSHAEQKKRNGKRNELKEEEKRNRMGNRIAATASSDSDSKQWN
jgi:hypothetical protein